MRKKVTVLLITFVLAMSLLPACGNEQDKAEDKLPQQIYLCGEYHENERCNNKELELWGEFYKKGARHLFIEDSYAAAAYLNEWMHSDSDEILEQLNREVNGKKVYSELYLNFYKTIKRDYPETVFHGTDLCHLFDTEGISYLEKLEKEGKMDTEEYRIAEENYEQGKKYYEYYIADADAEAGDYRENCLAENFIREYEVLSGEFVMGIYGWGHTDSDITTECWAGNSQTMVSRLMERYADIIHVEHMLWVDAIRTDKIAIAGKEYDAIYYGTLMPEDIMFLNILNAHKQFEFWTIEDGSEIYSSCEKDNGIKFVIWDCPMKIEDGQIVVIDITYIDGRVERLYFCVDGERFNGYKALTSIIVKE